MNKTLHKIIMALCIMIMLMLVSIPITLIGAGCYELTDHGNRSVSEGLGTEWGEIQRDFKKGVKGK